MTSPTQTPIDLGTASRDKTPAENGKTVVDDLWMDSLLEWPSSSSYRDTMNVMYVQLGLRGGLLGYSEEEFLEYQKAFIVEFKARTKREKNSRNETLKKYAQ